MRLRLQKYSLDVKYKPGPKMYISNTLSRASLPTAQVTTEDNCTIFQLQEQELIRNLANIDMEDALFVTDHRLSQIRVETSHDTTLQTLIKVTKKGWSEDENDSPLNIKEYWPYRDELFSENGLTYRGTQLIIPTKHRPEMITRAHILPRYSVNTDYSPRYNVLAANACRDHRGSSKV